MANISYPLQKLNNSKTARKKQRRRKSSKSGGPRKKRVILLIDSDDENIRVPPTQVDLNTVGSGILAGGVSSDSASLLNTTNGIDTLSNWKIQLDHNLIKQQ